MKPINHYLDQILEKFKPKELFKKVRDNREPRQVKWKLGYILQTTLEGLLGGLRTSREIENYSEDRGNRVPDSTLRSILSKVEEDDLLDSICNVVKRAQRDHVFSRSQILPINIVAIDGKRIAEASKRPDKEYFIKGRHGKWHCRALRAMLTSVEKPIFLGQHMIHRLCGEADSALLFIQDLISRYGRTKLLDTFSFDAGFASKKLVDFIDKSGYHYIQRIKANQKNLFTALEHDFECELGSEPVAFTEEKQSGKLFIRSLYRFKRLKGYGKWTHVSQAWCVRQETICAKTGERAIMYKYYLTNIPFKKLTPDQILLAIRKHWAVENNGFFTMDYSFKEDDYPFSNSAVATISALRILAFNLLALYAIRKVKNRNRLITIREVMNRFIRVIMRFEEFFPERSFESFA